MSLLASVVFYVGAALMLLDAPFRIPWEQFARFAQWRLTSTRRLLGSTFAAQFVAGQCRSLLYCSVYVDRSISGREFASSGATGTPTQSVVCLSMVA